MITIDWDALTKQTIKDIETDQKADNTQESGARPTGLSANSENLGRTKTSIHKGFEHCVPLAPRAPLKNEGVEVDDKNNVVKLPDSEKESIEKSRTTNLHPIAVCLFMSVARKMQCSNEELFNELVKLETMEPAEQIRTWAGYAVKNGLDPLKIVYPFTRSNDYGFDCMNCQHIDMKTAHQLGNRRLYHWSCRKHHNILEGYHGLERVLIAPAECTDYKPRM